MENKSKLNTALLVIIIILLGVGLTYIFLNNNSKQKAGEISSLNNLPQENQNATSQVPLTQNSTSQTTTTQTTTNQQQSPATNLKTYTNTKYGFSFQYPDNWSQWGTESETVCDIHAGSTCVFNIDFMDIASQGVEFYDNNNHQIGSPKDTLHVEYHFDSKGTTLYQYALSQYKLKQGVYAVNSRTIDVAGNTAIVSDNILTTDGKGKVLPSLRIITVDFLDKQQLGEVNLNFQTPVTGGDVEIAKFNQLLSSFKFTN